MPAFRDMQRAAVDKTFLDMLGQAQQLKGSVFDDPKSAAMRDAYEMAEAGPQAGVVANPGHKLFQQLQYRSPRFARGLERVPQTTEYLSKTIRQIPDAWGVTSTLPTATDRAAGLAGQIKSQRGITQEEIKRLAERGHGASLQSFPGGKVADETLFHEGLHSLYAPKNPATTAPNIPAERAQELIVRTMRRMGASDEATMAVLKQYGNDPAHGLVDVLAQYNAFKTGGSASFR